MATAIFDERNTSYGIDAGFLIVSALEVCLTITAFIFQYYIVGITTKFIFFLNDIDLQNLVAHSTFPGSGYVLSKTC
jgi:hypothetical protein